MYFPADPARPRDPQRIVPAIMTADEVCLFLRISSKNPVRTLSLYRAQGWLPSQPSGRIHTFLFTDVLEFARRRARGEYRLKRRRNRRTIDHNEEL